MKLGVCYYPEHWPRARWASDAAMMAAAGLRIVRIAEFAWQLMEPAEGRFAWDWLDEAIATLAQAGLEVVLGTPTAAPPAWLCAAYPDVLPVDNQGRRRRFGSRRHYCVNSPAYRRHTERIVTALAARYGRHPAVIGWQIDNEFGCHDTARCYCPHCTVAFRRWLQNRYGSLEALNEAWGTVFWSQTYDDWAQIEAPILTVGSPNPSHVLDYWRFASDAYRDYQQLQIDLLRAHTQGQWITTNFMGNYADLNYHDLAAPLDFVTWDSYPTGYAERYGPVFYRSDEQRPVFAWDVGDPYITGFCHDLTRGLKPRPGGGGTPFWVMEQQAGPINWGAINPGVRPGTVRLWTWHALAAGAEAVIYFRWRACLYGHEVHHSGLLKHDGTPDLGYHEVMRLATEAETLAAVAAYPPEPAPIALLLDYEDGWALQMQPHRRDFGYLHHLFVFYRAARQLGFPVDIVPYHADLTAYRLVIAGNAYLGTSAHEEVLERYVRDGGHVLFGVRSGFKTATNTATDAPLPGLWRPLVGATVRAWHALPNGVGYGLAGEVDGIGPEATFWAEALAPATARVLAYYTSGPFAGEAALTDNGYGTGHAFYLGFYPGFEQATALLRYLTARLDISPLVKGLPADVLAYRRGPYLLLLNFGDEAREVEPDGMQRMTVAPRDLVIYYPHVRTDT